MTNRSRIFRQEALESHSRATDERADLLHLSPHWVRWTFWLLLGLLVSASLYIMVASINEYASGVSVIRDEERTAVTSAEGGTIRRIAVKAGQKIEAGQPLVQFEDLQERIELRRLRNDFKSQQIQRLRNPNGPGIHEQLAALKSQIEAAEARLKERTLLAPRAGVIQDVRIRPNQFVNPGELLLTIVGENDRLTVISILPGHYRPLLKTGDRLRVELAGFPYAYQHLTIADVGSEVVGPGEIRRFLGPEVADSLTFQGPSVIVKAHLPTRSFKADGRSHEYHDGMHGIAEARIRSENFLAAFVPGLRDFLGEQQ